MSRLSVAVVGSGMAGLAAAHRCRQAGYQVTVFEAQSGYGMDAHSLPAHGGVVDMPLRVMSPAGWNSVLQLAAQVGVATYGVDTDVSCSRSNRRTWFRSARVPVTGWQFVDWRSVSLKAVRMGLGLLQLAGRRRALKLQPGISLREFLHDEPLDPLFWRGLLLPLLITICTCDEEHLLDWPAGQLLSLLDKLVYGGQLLRLQGGTPALVAALARGLHCHSGSPVELVVDQGEQVRVRNARGEGGLFDRVIIATQANHLGFLRGARYAREREQLSGIRYACGELVTHADERFMPGDRRDWAALNFQSEGGVEAVMFTVWVNAIEPSLASKPVLLQTWNPLFAPDPRKVLATVPLQRAVVHGGTAAILDKVARWHRAPQRKIFYCGSWAHEGVPLLETAVRSAHSVVDMLQQQGESTGMAGPNPDACPPGERC